MLGCVRDLLCLAVTLPEPLLPASQGNKNDRCFLLFLQQKVLNTQCGYDVRTQVRAQITVRPSGLLPVVQLPDVAGAVGEGGQGRGARWPAHAP